MNAQAGETLDAEARPEDVLTASDLRRCRLALGLTQAELGRLLGAAGNTIARWERGERAIGNPALVRLALAQVAAGQAALGAVEAVCEAAGDLGGEILGLLSGLVDNALVRRERQADGESRFLMLEPIREYALERLEESGEAAAVRRRHAAYSLALAEQADQGLRGAAQAVWLGVLEQEQDNLRGRPRGLAHPPGGLRCPVPRGRGCVGPGAGARVAGARGGAAAGHGRGWAAGGEPGPLPAAG